MFHALEEFVVYCFDVAVKSLPDLFDFAFKLLDLEQSLASPLRKLHCFSPSTVYGFASEQHYYKLTRLVQTNSSRKTWSRIVSNSCFYPSDSWLIKQAMRVFPSVGPWIIVYLRQLRDDVIFGGNNLGESFIIHAHRRYFSYVKRRWFALWIHKSVGTIEVGRP